MTEKAEFDLGNRKSKRKEINDNDYEIKKPLDFLFLNNNQISSSALLCIILDIRFLSHIIASFRKSILIMT